MEGRNVEIFLATPLFRFKYVQDGGEKQLLESAVRISGKVVSEKAAGIVVKTDAISNLKISETNLPFKEIFIPFAKIDYMIVL